MFDLIDAKQREVCDSHSDNIETYTELAGNDGMPASALACFSDFVGYKMPCGLCYILMLIGMWNFCDENVNYFEIEGV